MPLQLGEIRGFLLGTCQEPPAVELGVPPLFFLKTQVFNVAWGQAFPVPISKERFLKEGKRGVKPLAFLKQHKAHAFPIREVIEGTGLLSGWNGGTFIGDLLNLSHLIPILDQLVRANSVEVRIVKGEPYYRYIGDDKL